MDEILRRQFIEAGVDVDKALACFMGKQELLVRFLRQFLSDENYNNMIACVEEEDYEGAFRAAHNLKGLCGSLFLVSLQQVVSEQTELFRAEKWEEAKEMMQQVTEVYDDTVRKLTSLLQGC